MRKEAKIAIVSGMFVMVLAGWFYFGRGPAGADVPLSGAGTAAAPKPPDARSPAPGAHAAADSARPPVRTEPIPGMVSWTKPEQSVAAAPVPPPSVKQRALPAIVDDPPVERSSLAERPGASEHSGTGNRSADAEMPPPAALQQILAGQTVSHEDEQARAAAEPVAPAPSEPISEVTAPTHTYKVARGDTLALVSELHYNSQRYTDLLMAANPQITNKQLIRVGMVLNVPPLEELLKISHSATPPNTASGAQSDPARPDLEAAKPAPALNESGDAYTVKTGDTLYSISTRLLGAGGRWREILELNKEMLDGQPGNLRAGQVLKLPAAKKS